MAEAARPVPTIVYATEPGGTTLDKEDGGGNPFAAALIELSNKRGLILGELLPALKVSTFGRSSGHQSPNWDRPPANSNWAFSPSNGVGAERRIALVLVVSDYADSDDVNLPGAARDERRVAAMLASHGFSLTQGVAANKKSLQQAIRTFRQRSRACDVAIVYSTGHGIEHAEQPFLLPGDYPLRDGFGPALLRKHAVPVAGIASACAASKLNLTFFAGCRSLGGVVQ